MKRTVTTLLWFLAGWCAGSMAAWLLGVTPLLAPMVAVAAAAFVVRDPRHLFWIDPAPSVQRLQAAVPPTFEADRLT